MLETPYRRFRLTAGLAVFILIAVPLDRLLGQDQPELPQNLTYQRGQPVIPAYEGWHPNPDGTIDLWFGYLNQNWQEEIDIPVGSNNLIEPAEYGPDGGQPTHFFPRVNHWEFAVRVPKDFGSKEVVWTLTSHGHTYRTYATLKSGYIHDDMGVEREFNNSIPPPGNKPPILTVEGEKVRTVKVDQPITLSAVATDDGLPRARVESAPSPAKRRGPSPGVAAGGDNGLRGATGLRLGWYLFRGPSIVRFDPPQFEQWEDARGGSPWSPTWVNPPIPPDNRWIVHVSFDKPGTYVLRCRASDGFFNADQNVTFIVER
ncbi:MAG: hypothetical protein ABSB35_32850 [Bryobacteraceae bacterium]|jgi:hypothetical protein